MRRLPAHTVYLIIEGAFGVFINIIFTVSMVNQVQRLGLSPLQLVLTGTALEVSALIAELPTGIVADVFGRRLSVVISFFVVGLGFIIEGAALSFGVLLLAQVVWGVGWTFHSGALEAWLVDEIGQTKASDIFARASQVSGISSTAGSLVGIALAAFLPVNHPILLGGALCAGLGAFLAVAMPENNFKPRPREKESLWHHLFGTFLEGTRVIRGQPLLVLFLGLFFVLGAYSEGFDRLSTAHLLQNFALPGFISLPAAVWVGITRMGGHLGGVGMVSLARRNLNQEDSQAVARRLAGLSGIWLAALLVFALSRSWALAIAAYLATAAVRRGIAPIILAWQNQHIGESDSSVRATVLSTYGQADALGQVAGGPVVGMVGNVSIRAALLFSTALLTPAVAIFAKTARQKN